MTNERHLVTGGTKIRFCIPEGFGPGNGYAKKFIEPDARFDIIQDLVMYFNSSLAFT